MNFDLISVHDFLNIFNALRKFSPNDFSYAHAVLPASVYQDFICSLNSYRLEDSFISVVDDFCVNLEEHDLDDDMVLLVIPSRYYSAFISVFNEAVDSLYD